MVTIIKIENGYFVNPIFHFVSTHCWASFFNEFLTFPQISWFLLTQTGTMVSMSSPPSPAPSLLRRIVDFDTAISLRLYTLTHPILPYYFLKTLEISGDGFLFFPLVLSLLLYPLAFSDTKNSNIFLINLLLGGILDLIVIGPLKHLIRRPRPVYNKNMFLSFAVDHWSFPSGHSSRVSMIATLFYLSSDFIRDVLIQLKYDLFVDYLMLIVIGWAATTSCSRVLLGRHFVFDVIAGVLLGILEGLFVFRIFNYVTFTSFFTWRSCKLYSLSVVEIVDAKLIWMKFVSLSISVNAIKWYFGFI